MKVCKCTSEKPLTRVTKKAMLVRSMQRHRRRFPAATVRCCWLVPLLLLSQIESIWAMQKRVGWQTDSGYDNDEGEDPICWDTTLNITLPGLRPDSDDPSENNATSSDEEAQEQEEFEDFFDDFDQGRSERTVLRSSCHDGLNFSIAAVTPPTDNTFFSGDWYAFRMQLSVNVSEVYLQDHTSLAGVLVPTNKVFLRMVCCNNLKVGFCDPFNASPPPKKGDSRDEEEIEFESADDSSSLIGIDGIPISPVLDGVEVNDKHIIGPFLPWDMTDDGDGVFSTKLDMRFRIPATAVGVYNVIGHVVMIFGPPGDSVLVTQKVDVADIMPSRSYTLQQPPTIQDITDSFKIAVGIILGVAGAFLLSLLWFVVRHRDHGVMKMAQAPFLAALVFFALVATACSAFYLPTRDIFCNLAYPFVLTSLSLMGNILIGRMWRLHLILNTSMRISAFGVRRRRRIERFFMTTLSVLADWEKLFCFWKYRETAVRRRESLSSHSLRKEVKNSHLLQLIITLTLPQIIVQVVTLIFYPAEVVVELNEAETIGRVECQCGEVWPEAVGLTLVGLSYLVAVVIAVITRDLPSILNETKSIVSAAWASLIVVSIGSMILILTNVEPTSPNIQAFVLIVMTLGITLPTCCYIVVPKVQRVRSGEKVVMSSLFLNQRQSSLSDRSSGAPSVPSTTPTTNGTDTANSSGGQQVEEGVTELTKAVKADRQHQSFVMKRDEPPPRRLEVRLLTMKELLSHISKSSTEGRQISRSEWELLKSSSDSLHTELDKIEFGWSEEDEDSVSPEVREERDALKALVSSDHTT